MKKIAVFITAVIFVLSLAACERNDGSAPAGWISASDEKADFRFYVPDEWTVDFSTAAAGAYYSSDDPSSVSVMAWELEYTDTTIDEWWKLNVGDLSLVFQNIELISDENTTVDGIYAKSYTYTASISEFNYKIMQTVMITDATVYLFTYTSTPENFDSHLEDVDAMLDYLTLE